jgi:serine/threonine protein kinase
MAQWFAGRFSGKPKDSSAAHQQHQPSQTAAANGGAHAELPRAHAPVVVEVAPQPAPPAPDAPPAPPAAPLTIGSYVMKETLGVGAFGKVKLAEHRETGELFAIKCIQKSRISAARQFERLQRHAPHPRA